VSAHFYDNEILIIKESRFYKMYNLLEVKETDFSKPGIVKGQLRFEPYHEIEVSGFISFQPGQPYFRLATNKYIYSYKFNQQQRKDYIPEHVSTMVNFNQCTNMYFGSQGVRCIVY
jgi:hypothetical protein